MNPHQIPYIDLRELGIKPEHTYDDLVELIANLVREYQARGNVVGSDLLVKAVEYWQSLIEEVELELRDAVSAFEDAMNYRNAMIVQISHCGYSSRAIAKIVGLSHVTIRKMLDEANKENTGE